MEAARTQELTGRALKPEWENGGFGRWRSVRIESVERQKTWEAAGGGRETTAGRPGWSQQIGRMPLILCRRRRAGRGPVVAEGMEVVWWAWGELGVWAQELEQGGSL